MSMNISISKYFFVFCRLEYKGNSMNPYIFCILGFYLTGTQISFSIGYPSYPSYGDPSRLYQRKLEHSLPFDANELKADLEGIAGKTIRIE